MLFKYGGWVFHSKKCSHISTTADEWQVMARGTPPLIECFFCDKPFSTESMEHQHVKGCIFPGPVKQGGESGGYLSVYRNMVAKARVLCATEA